MNTHTTKPSILFFADPNWSSGSIIKDLQILLPQYSIDICDWATVPESIDPKYDAVIGMTLTVAYGCPHIKLDASISCSEYDMEFALTKSNHRPEMPLIGGISPQICDQLVKDYPDSTIMFTPATARSSRFKRREVRWDMVIAGWCGNP
jgi:hypothetical protein